jgi:hypothetical protein
VVARRDGRFAKPLDWATGLGGSNPPLSALEPTEPVLSRQDHGTYDQADLTMMSKSSRPNAADPEPVQTLRATRGATRIYLVDDPELAAVVDAWPEVIRAGTLAMVRTASPER